jgi:hypothetical protein
MAAVTPCRFARAYVKHCKEAFPEYGPEDFGYSWGWFTEMRHFFARIGPTGRSEIFTADQ